MWKANYLHIWRNPRIVEIRRKRHLFWDPLQNYGPPQQGWFLFYLQFEYCWVDWLLAGAIHSDYCLIYLYGSILDITTFIPNHPGSPESLMEAAGSDASEQFHDIGHSVHAIALLHEHIIWTDDKASTINNEKDLSTTKQDIRAITSIYSNKIRRYRQSRHHFTNYQSLMNIDRIKVLQIANNFNELDFTNPYPSPEYSTVHTSVSILSNPLSLAPPDDINTNTSSSADLSPFSPGTPDQEHNHSRLHPLDSSRQRLLLLKQSSTVRRSGSSSICWHLGMGMGSSNLNECFAASGQPRIDHVIRTMLPSIGGFHDCCKNIVDGASQVQVLDYQYKVKHFGQPRAIFDPLEQSWMVWWTCCGAGTLVSLE